MSSLRGESIPGQTDRFLLFLSHGGKAVLENYIFNISEAYFLWLNFMLIMFRRLKYSTIIIPSNTRLVDSIICPEHRNINRNEKIKKDFLITCY